MQPEIPQDEIADDGTGDPEVLDSIRNERPRNRPADRRDHRGSRGNGGIGRLHSSTGGRLVGEYNRVPLPTSTTLVNSRRENLLYFSQVTGGAFVSLNYQTSRV